MLEEGEFTREMRIDCMKKKKYIVVAVRKYYDRCEEERRKEALKRQLEAGQECKYENKHENIREREIIICE